MTPEEQRIARREAAVMRWAEALNPELVQAVREMDGETRRVQGVLRQVQQMRSDNPDFPQVYEAREAQLTTSVKTLTGTRDEIRRELTEAYLRSELEHTVGGEVDAVETAALLRRATQALDASRALRSELQRQSR